MDRLPKALGAGWARRAGGERGIALLMVLFVITMLSIIASEYIESRRIDSLATRNFMDETQAYYAARAGLNLAATEILRLPRCVYRDPDLNILQGCSGSLVYTPEGESSEPDKKAEETSASAPLSLLGRLQLPQGVAIGRGAVRVILEDDESKLNLNSLSSYQLERLLRFTGVVDDQLRSIIVDSILDWRDHGNARRLNGAESDYYKSLPQPYEAKNGNFDSVEELLLVRCVSPALFHGTGGQLPPYEPPPDCPAPSDSDEYLGLVHFLTVGGRGPVNLNTAPLLVLQALGVSQTVADHIVAGRPHRLLPRQARRYRGLTTTSTSFYVVAEGFFPGSPNVRRVAARIEQGGAGSRSGPIVVSAWDDNVLRAPQPPSFAGFTDGLAEREEE
ncbi:MAG: general secretion pathway protein GspK [Candidatus Tectomicrobia bacterium]|nr:general secretion pathway protein GspK [Candidatus Tectomicrobia bacterium]